MRSEDEVAEYRSQVLGAKVFGHTCRGVDPDCACRKECEFEVSAFEACIPRDFWFIKPGSVKHTGGVFDDVVKVYCARLRVAKRHGYGLALLGDNGVGKTMFLSYVLAQAVRDGFTAYYTTLPRLDHDIKRGFRDQVANARLAWMLTSDFLAIDEMGKEHFQHAGDSFMRTQLERILKERYDDGSPTLLASNADAGSLGKVYGATIESILNGKYQVAALEPGDFRRRLREAMDTAMGYK